MYSGKEWWPDGKQCFFVKVEKCDKSIAIEVPHFLCIFCEWKVSLSPQRLEAKKYTNISAKSL